MQDDKFQQAELHMTFPQLGTAFSVMSLIGIGVGIALLAARFDEYLGVIGALCINIGISSFLLWRVSREQGGSSLDLNPMTIILLGGMASKVMGLYHLTYGSFESNLSIFSGVYAFVRDADVYPFMIFAEGIYAVGALALFGAWRASESIWPIGRIPFFRDKSSSGSINSLFFQTYAVGLVVTLLAGFSPDLAKGFGQATVVANILVLAGVTGLLIWSPSYRIGTRGMWFPLLLLTPLLPTVIYSGTKSAFLLVMLPLVLASAVVPFRRRLLLVSGVFFAFVLIIIPFTGILRQYTWGEVTSGQNEYSTAELARLTQIEQSDRNWIENFLDSFDFLAYRVSTLEGSITTLSMREYYGPSPYPLFEDLASGFIPRFLWPEKPNFAPGAWYTWYLGFAQSPETASTSTAMYLTPELYWLYGWYGVFFGMALLGLYLRWIWMIGFRAISKGGGGGFAILLSMLIFCIRIEEVHVYYAITGPLISTAYLLAYSVILRYFKGQHYGA